MEGETDMEGDRYGERDIEGETDEEAVREILTSVVGPWCSIHRSFNYAIVWLHITTRTVTFPDMRPVVAHLVIEIVVNLKH